MKDKRVWRKNFAVQRCHYLMATPCIYDAITFQDKTLGKNILKEMIWLHKGVDNLGSYVPVDELRELVEATMKAFIEEPEMIEEIHEKTEEYNDEFFEYCNSIVDTDFSKLEKKEVIEIYKKLNYYQKVCHGYAIPTTWFVDSDGEDLSKYLINKTKKIIKEKGSKLNFAEAFSVLTTPEKMSFAIKEEIESFQVLEMIDKDEKAKEIFSQDFDQVEKDIDKLNEELKDKIIAHHKKWQWTPFTYMGPAYELSYYLQVWSGLIKEKTDIRAHLEKLENYSNDVKEQKEKIIKELDLEKQDIQHYKNASDIIYLKAYRKDCLFYEMFILDRIFKEIAKWLHLSKRQVTYIADWEIIEAMEKEEFDANILNDRIKFSVYHQKDEKGVIYTGDEAEEFLKNYNFEKEQEVNVNEMEGTCACPGIVKGIVKVINQPEEMEKMEERNIMVAHTTFPSLVPAMKKASAIVTDDGGITCHAAIVARELKTPCVVGTKIATKALKDGDEIEVDAEKGVVKIIKKNEG